MEPAPYGGFMTRTIDGEREQKELLEKQEVEVTVEGASEVLRPNAVHVRGVDNLSTAQIEAFVDLYLNTEGNAPDYHRVDDPVWFRVQWIDDSNANVLFHTHADAALALAKLSEHWPNVENHTEEKGPVFSEEYLASLVEERSARSYAVSIPYCAHRQHLKELAEGSDLFQAKKEEIQQQKAESMDEDGSSVVLYIRQAFQSDRKVKNAAAYSRYYLLHGEPDRSRPRPSRRDDSETCGRGGYARDNDNSNGKKKADTEDLFAEKFKASAQKRKAQEVDEDLFAWRLRERSPQRN